MCRQIELEQHKGPCRCSCQETEASCLPHQVWSQTNCQCQCPPSDGPAKYQCARDNSRQWDDVLCSCQCRDSARCPPGQEVEPDTCQCREGQEVSQCSVSPLYSVTTSHTARLATYIGLLAIAMVTVTILATLYLMATKKRPYRDLRWSCSISFLFQSVNVLTHFRGESSPGSVSVVPQAAYSITINQPGQRSPSPPASPLCLDTDKTRM